MRTARIHRATRETDITLTLRLDGRGRARVRSGIRFLDHMLETVARHGALDLELEARGDLDVDQHHTVEDIGLVLGEAVRRSLGGKRGIRRAGWWLMPMDEALAAAAVDFSGRPAFRRRWTIGSARVGDLQTALLDDFFEAFAQSARAAVHLRVLEGRSSHHKVEAVFKAFARALRVAAGRDSALAGVLPSTKGLL